MPRSTATAKEIKAVKQRALDFVGAGKVELGKPYDEVMERLQLLEPLRPQFQCVRTQEALDIVGEAVLQARICGLDTETTGLNEWRDRVVGVCVYTPGIKGAYIATGHSIPGVEERLDEQCTIDMMMIWFKRWIEAGVKFIFHHAKFDVKMIFTTFGLRLPIHWDTQIAAELLNENEGHGLKELWTKYCAPEGLPADLIPQSYGKLFDKVRFDWLDPYAVTIYGARDAVMTWDLYQFQRPFLTPADPDCQRHQLEQTAHLFLDTEMPLIDAFIDAEMRGLGFDEAYTGNLREQYRERRDRLRDEMYAKLAVWDFTHVEPEKLAKLSDPINLNSPTQLAIVFYDGMRLPVVDKQKPRGTGIDILEHWARDKHLSEEVRAFCELLIEHRIVEKLLTTYIDGFPQLVEKTTHRIHPTFYSNGAVTGRISSRSPNAQNLPRKRMELRGMIIPSPGYYLVSGDYSQIEPRGLAHLSQDPQMLEAYRSGRDLYATMASQIYSLPYEECREVYPDGTKNPEGKKRRDEVKSVLLGIMYGRGGDAIAEQLGLTREQGRRIVARFFEAFPKVRDCIDEQQRLARERGWAGTFYGRKRRLPALNWPKYELFWPNGSPVPLERARPWIRKLEGAFTREQAQAVKLEVKAAGFTIRDNTTEVSHAERQVLNSILQGSSADITKRAMVAIMRDEELKRLGFYTLTSVHDEIVGEAPKEQAAAALDRLCFVMKEVAADLSVPIAVDGEISERWGGHVIEDDLDDVGG